MPTGATRFFGGGMIDDVAVRRALCRLSREAGAEDGAQEFS
jgi:hypothetical protein